jgi:hypothetical protein
LKSPVLALTQSETLAVEPIHSRWSDKVLVVDIAAVPNRYGEEPTIATAANLESQDLIRLACSSGFQHIVQASTHFPNEINTAALMSSEPDQFIKHPLASILDPTGVSADREQSLTGLSIEVRTLQQRKEIRARTQEYLEKIACPQTLFDDVHLIIDELISNAVYNAPYQVRSSETNPGIARVKNNDTIPGNLAAKLFLGKLENRLVIGVQDPFGALEPPRLLQRFERCQTEGVGQNIRWGKGGAGIGSFMVYERSSSLYMGVHQSRSTVICSQVSLIKSARARSLLPKSIHWFDEAL